MARHFVPRHTTAPNPTKQNYENVARSATSMQATNAQEATTTQHVIVGDRCDGHKGVLQPYGSGGPRLNARTLSADGAPLSAPLTLCL
jgi:hypothetical protein